MIAKEIALLNQITLESLGEQNRNVIVKKFTDTGLKILKGDFGFAWWKFEGTKEYVLAYKSKNTPYSPNIPRKQGGNYLAQKTKNPVFVSDIHSQRYQKRFNVRPYMESYVIIPVFFQRSNYGNLVVCFKRKRIFSSDDRILCKTLGNVLAQAITIHELYFNLSDFKDRLDKTLDSVFIFNPVTFQIEYANLGAMRQLGFTGKELLKKTFFDIQPKMGPAKFHELVSPLISKHRESLTVESVIKTKKGKTVPVDLFLQLTGSLGSNRKFLSIVHDISARKKLQQESQRLLKQKNEFLSIASHEIKTPVTTIKGFAELVKMDLAGGKTAAVYGYLEKVNFQVDKLTRLVNDLLDISRIETGRLKFRRSYFELNRLMETIISDSDSQAKGHKIIFKCSRKIWLFADPDRIGQVLINLINNAVKYSPKGKRIIVSLGEEHAKAKVAVEDFGPGIPKNKLEKIFNRFVQNSPDTGAHAGLGLGLYISNNIVKAHKGELSCRKKKGKGMVFYFTVPYRKCKKIK